MIEHNLVQKPWYKQIWPWLLILLPASAVTASLFTVFIFNQHQVSLVSEDYYKEGKAINQDLSLSKKAATLGIEAYIREKNGEIVIVLDKGDLNLQTTQAMPIKLELQHRTLAQKDIETTLIPDAKGDYRLLVDVDMSGPWFVKISDFNASWRIGAKVSFPTDNPVKLQGKN